MDLTERLRRYRRTKALVALSDGVNRVAIEAVLGGGSSIEVLGYSDGLDGEWSEFFDRPSDVVIVACAARSDETAQLVARAVRQRPDRPVVILAEQAPSGSLRPAFEAGADDLIVLSQTPEEVRGAIERVVARRRGASLHGSPPASLICVLGPKGGSGKTLVSTNLAVELARRDMRVVLVDLDLRFGDVGLALGLFPNRTIYDLMLAGPPFDHDKLERHLMLHASGVKVLVAPTRPDRASAVSIDYLRAVYASLCTMCDIVIVDTPPDITPEAIATIDVSTAACMVGMLDSVALKNTKLGLETLDLMGYPFDSVVLVLNRANSRVGITPDDVLAILGRAPDILIPSDREIPRSLNEGTPIVSTRENSEAASSFRALADIFTDLPGAQARPLPPPASPRPPMGSGVREPRRPIKPRSSASATVDPTKDTELPNDVRRPRKGHGRAA